jgi:hypothetical protein
MFNNTDSTASSNTRVEGFIDTAIQFPQLSKSQQAPDVRRAEFIPGLTGPFRPLIEEYLTTFVPSSHKPSTVLPIRSSLAKFFLFVRDQQIAERKEPHVQ